MAGGLTISTLNDSSGVLATQNGMSGIAKAWVNFNGTGTVAIRGSMNVSSITRGGIGNYTINFTTAMPDINYSITALNAGDGSYGSYGVYVFQQATPTTSSVNISTRNNAGTYVDVIQVNASVFR